MSDGAPPFAHRGIVEGFYGTPWSWADRGWWVETLASLGMNRFVLAPKDDPFHRERWREAPPVPWLDDFDRLTAAGADCGVAVGAGVSPGLSIRASHADDVATLCRRFTALTRRGARLLVLALDDVPDALSDAGDRASFPSLAAAHVALAHAVREACPDATLWFVPNDYTGRTTTPYLEELGETLAPGIEVAWTGPETLSPRIDATAAAERAALLRRRLLLWDNVPVADGPMRRMLHLGRYLGRDPALPDHASGILLNPMSLPRASAITVACAAAYLRDPANVDPERAWQDAVARLGTGAPRAFARFAAAHRFAPQDPEPDDGEVGALVRRLEQALASDGDVWSAAEDLHAMLGACRAVAEGLAGLADRAVADEIAPWVAGHHEEARRMDAAAQALVAVFDPAVDEMARCTAYSVFEGSLTLHPAPATVSFGPRRVFYPQLVSHRRADAGFGDAPAVFEHASLSDRVVELATDACLPRLGAVRSRSFASSQGEE